MTILNVEKLNKPYRFNMVNSNDPKFVELGLEPLYLTVYPRYINLKGNLFYSGLSHYESKLSNDIVRILQIMNSNYYDRDEQVYGFLNDDYPIRFMVYNHQIFFSDYFSLDVYKNNLHIRDEINKKYNLSDEFYEPTMKEIFRDYWKKYFFQNKNKYGNVIKHYRFNLTPQEYFERMILSQRQNLSPFMTAHELDAHDIRNWLNYNANVFMDFRCSWETLGIYNDETMAFINSLKETKLEIYNYFNHLAKQSKDWKKTVKSLLIKYGVYSEFIAKERINENPFDNDGMFDESNHWSRMFHKASFDILVSLIGLDKIETCVSNTITTSKPNIYEEFFNPMVMGYDVVQIPRLLFDVELQDFRWIYPNDFINTGMNRECEEEINLIRKYVPFDERYKYLRK